ncbi:MAG: hypothetical protein K9K82_14475 [Desulfobacteraceae bacterium]|nr:hypothetical protein [Desulfobacteraceae bacterium]
MNTLERALPIVARTISEKHSGKLNVFVGGNRACTDGKNIYLPTLPESKEARILARGYIDHEAAHIRYTDFQVKNDSMTNALEDIRIEKLISKTFLGARKNLRDLTNWFVQQNDITVSDKDSDHDVLAKYVHFKLRKEVLGHNVGNLLDEGIAEMLRRLGKDVMQKADKIVAGKMQSTADASRRAQKLRALLPQNNQQDQQSQQGQQSQQSQGGQQGQGQGQGGSGDDSDGSSDESGQSGQPGQGDSGGQNGQGQGQDQDGQNDQDGQGNGSGESGEDQDGADQSGQDGQPDNSNDSGDSGDSEGSQDPGQNQEDDQACGQGGNSAGSGNADSEISAEPGRDISQETFQGLGETAREALNQISQSAGKDLGFLQQVRMPGVTTAKTSGDLNQTIEAQLEEARLKSVKLRHKLQGVLESKRRDRERTTRSGRKIDGKKVYRLSCGDTRVFSRKREHSAVNTAVHLLLDTSGSMSGTDLDRARQACYSLGLAMENLKYVNLAISSFPGMRGIHEIKRFGRSLQMKSFNIGAMGGTPAVPAMLHAAYTLATQPEPRKMIFVITDGGPDRPELVPKMEDWLASCGVEVFGLGIRCSAVKQVFREAIVVDHINELATEIFKALQKKL